MAPRHALDVPVEVPCIGGKLPPAAVAEALALDHKKAVHWVTDDGRRVCVGSGFYELADLQKRSATQVRSM